MGRTRSCQAGVIGENGCTGDFEQTKSCYNEGAYSEWEFASDCSKVCGGGTRIKRRENTCTGPEEEVVSCNEHTGTFSDWSTWSACSKTVCGGGLQKRSKIQSCTFEVVFETKNCNENAGLFGPWTEWTECTRSCGGGSQTRSQTHSCNEKINVEKRFCGTEYCPIWEGWGSWAPCSVSCGVGTQTKHENAEEVTLVTGSVHLIIMVKLLVILLVEFVFKKSAAKWIGVDGAIAVWKALKVYNCK